MTGSKHIRESDMQCCKCIRDQKMRSRGRGGGKRCWWISREIIVGEGGKERIIGGGEEGKGRGRP